MFVDEKWDDVVLCYYLGSNCICGVYCKGFKQGIGAEGTTGGTVRKTEVRLCVDSVLGCALYVCWGLERCARALNGGLRVRYHECVCSVRGWGGA